MKRIGLFIAIIVVSVHVSGQELWAYQAPTALSVLSEDVAWSMSASVPLLVYYLLGYYPATGNECRAGLSNSIYADMWKRV